MTGGPGYNVNSDRLEAAMNPGTKGAIFIDNLTIASADRLLHQRYDDVRTRRASIASGVVRHDLINLTQLIESVVCHNVLHVNAEFVGIWNNDIENTTLAPLRGVVVPVGWVGDDRLEAEKLLASHLPSFDTAELELAEFVGSSHSCGVSRVAPHVRELLIPRTEQHPWGTPHYIAVGTAFYLMCSQLLGLPYKPSFFRSQLLNRFVYKNWNSRPVAAAELSLALLEKNREEVARKYFEHLLELNIVELRVPCVLAAVLREASSRSDVLSVAMQIRESKTAIAFREWTGSFAEVIQHGDLTSIGRYIKEVSDVVRAANDALGLTPQSDLQVSLAWGPAATNLAFGLPAVLKKPIYLKRHLWFLNNMYAAAAIPRVSDHIQRVLFSELPEGVWWDALHHDEMRHPVG